MSSIYQLTTEAKQLASLLSEGDLTPEIEDALVINQNEIQEKATNYAYVVKSFESDIDAIDSEIKRLTALKTARKNAIERMKEAVKNALEIYGIEKIESPILKISIKSNPESLEIVNESQIPEIYRKEKVLVSFDKVAIKEAIKSGIEIEGAILRRGTRLEIK